jgi:hypothetical protein
MLPCDTVPCGILYAACGMGRPGFLWSTVCQVYNGSRQSGVRKLDNVNLNLGMCYLYIGSLIPEVRPRRSIPAMLLSRTEATLAQAVRRTAARQRCIPRDSCTFRIVRDRCAFRSMTGVHSVV